MRYSPVKNNLSIYFKRLFLPSTPFQNFSLFLLVPVFVGIGITIFFGLTKDINPATTIISIIISGLTTYYLRNNHLIFLSTLVLTLIIAGFAFATLRSHIVHTPMLTQEYYQAEIQGRIAHLKPSLRGQHITLTDYKLAEKNNENLPERLRIHSAGHDNDVQIGDYIKIKASLRPISGPSSPNGFDLQRYLYFQGIGGLGFSYQKPEVLKRDENYSFFKGLNQYFSGLILQADSLTPEQKSVALALLTGNRGTLKNHTREDIRIAGLAHLLAISGLHIGLVGGFIFFTLRLLLSLNERLALLYPIKKWAALGAIIGAFGFTMMTGASIPTVRAFIMMSVVFGAVLIDRRAVSIQTVAWAALIILILFPESLMTASFQLSFAAVTALVLFYNRKIEGKKTQRTMLHYVKGVFLTSVIASLATAPFTAFHFNQFSGYGIFANLAAVPLTAFVVMPAGLIGMILSVIGGEVIAFPIMGWGIDAVLWVAGWVAALPYADLYIPAMPPVSFYAFIAAICCFLCIPYRLRYFLAGAFSLMALVVGLRYEPAFLYVTADKYLTAMKHENGQITANHTRKGRYTRKQWAALWGQSVRDFHHHNMQMQCDHILGRCQITQPNGLRIDLLDHPYGVVDSCQHADVIISPRYNLSSNCAASYQVQRVDLQRNGSYALYENKADGTIRLKSVRDHRGQRPWVPLRPETLVFTD